MMGTVLVMQTRSRKRYWDSECKILQTTSFCTLNLPENSSRQAEKTSYLHQYLEVWQYKKHDGHCISNADKMLQRKLRIGLKIVVNDKFLQILDHRDGIT